jgi:hypothetical protein
VALLARKSILVGKQWECTGWPGVREGQGHRERGSSRQFHEH